MDHIDDTFPPFDETGRLAALHALALLDSEPEKEFDALVALAADLLNCPTALLTLIDSDRQWVKASAGSALPEIKRDVAICDTTIRQSEALVIDDLNADLRFKNNPLVVQDGLRFYAGTAIHALDPNGVSQPIGALCVVDQVPRSLSPSGRKALDHLASLAEALIAARRTALEAIQIATTGTELAGKLARNDRVFRQAERMAMMGSWRLNLAGNTLEWSDNVFRIHGLAIGDMPPLDRAMRFYPLHARTQVSDTLARSIETGEPFELESDFVTAEGQRRRVRAMGEAEMVDGRPTAIVGVFQDVTERHAMEMQLRRSADTDALTGIANRAAFDRALNAAMARARQDDTPLLLALIDLDGFKAINDSLGHGAGDDVLSLTAAALSEPWLRNCLAARIGGDEFALIIEDSALAADPEGLAGQIAAALQVSVEVGGVTMHSAGSVGIAAFDPTIHSLRDFARRADAVLYAAKRARVGQRPQDLRKRAAA